MKTLDIVLIAIALVVTAITLYLHFDMSRTYPAAEIEGFFKPVTSMYGVKIAYDIGDDFYSPLENPPIPAGPPRGSEVEPIRHQVLLRYPARLQKAFDKYPVEVIKNHLNAIYFCGEIDDGDLKYGGTYDPFRRIIYLVDSGGKNDELSMGTFHHEFSSLLLKAHSFFINPWTDHNPKDFVYLTEKYKDWKILQKEVDISTKGSAKDYENGFMRAYGQTDFENDFNEYAEAIFTYPQKFKKIMNQYPRVRAKFLVWLEFYHKIDPTFTEAYLLGEG